MEGAFVAGAVAHEQSQALVVERTVVSEAAAFERFGATAQPVVLGHTVDQYALGFVFGAMLAVEIGEEEAVGFDAFAREEEENAVRVAEAVAGVIAGRGGFAFFRFGAGGLFGVGAIGGNLGFGRHSF